MATDGGMARPSRRSRRLGAAVVAARDADRRRRIADAFVEAVGTVGLSPSRVTEVSRMARVSNRTFYAMFGDKEACYLYAFEERAKVVTALAREAYDATDGCWERRVRAGLEAVMAYLVAHPAYARFCLVERSGLSPAGLVRVHRVLRECQRGFERYDSDGVAPPLQGGVLTSMLAEVVSRPIQELVEADELDKLPELAARLAYFVAFMVVGRERAERELATAGGEQVGHGSD